MKLLVHRNRLIGIQPRQWLYILLAVFVTLAFNTVALWQNVGWDVILQILSNRYSPYPYNSFQIIYNPLPAIVIELIPIDVFLVFLAWFAVFISARVLFRRLPPILKYSIICLLAVALARVFAITAGWAMPLVWLPKFHDYLLGMPVSTFAIYWSDWVVFPVTALILAYAMLVSRPHDRTTPNVA